MLKTRLMGKEHFIGRKCSMDDRHTIYAEALLFQGRISNLICELEIFESTMFPFGGGKFEISQALAHLREADINMNRFLTKY